MTLDTDRQYMRKEVARWEAAGLRPAFDGAVVFRLMDTHGFPLPMAIDEVFASGMTISWSDFIDAARAQGWWDFKTHDVIRNALIDAEVDAFAREQIMLRFKLYVMANRHPKMMESV